MQVPKGEDNVMPKRRTLWTTYRNGRRYFHVPGIDMDFIPTVNERHVSKAIPMHHGVLPAKEGEGNENKQDANNLASRLLL